MILTPQACYLAIKSHDRRFDGLFFTCVSSTRIYCRPICPARTPKQKYCTFVTTPAEAEAAGYRPCLRCRPERAPFDHATNESESTPATRLAARIHASLLTDEKLTNAGRELSISDRHLRRLFVATYGVEPLRYLTTCRLLFAKQLLQDTALPIAQVAYAAGFTSPDRLTVRMRQAYGFTPSQFRKGSPQTKHLTKIALRTEYRPPFNWDALLVFLAGRATPYEWVANNTYHRLIDGQEVAVTNAPDRCALIVSIPAELSRDSYRILQRVRTVFDLDANPHVIATALSRDALLRPIIERHAGLRVPGCWDDFEMLLRVIVGQQVSVAGATTIMGRLVDRLGITPAAIAASSPEVIAGIGMPLKRATTIWTAGRLVQSGDLDLTERNPSHFFERLIAVPGIGPWTAEYLSMRVSHWPDAFPAGDLGLQKAVTPGTRQTERELLGRAETWRPWRSYAAMLLWKSLQDQGG